MKTVLYVHGFDFTAPDAPLPDSILDSVAIVASQRLYDALQKQHPDISFPERIPVVPLTKCFHAIAEVLTAGNVTVVASGDPLFFGICRKLKEEFPDQQIRVYPALSSMQLCFARFGIPWDDARFLSLHGRNKNNLAAKILRHHKVFIFTDNKNSPDAVSKHLLEECGKEGLQNVHICVAENLGFESERLYQGSLRETAQESFQEPNVMIVINDAGDVLPTCRFGLQEEEIRHSRGLITKQEVRAAAVHALRLPECGVLWDVGAGSGSVGLEAARMFPELSVLAIEKKEEQWQNVQANRQKFRTWNLQLIKGEAPEALAVLPAPDRIFVGGSGGNLTDILEHCVNSLLPGGIIVVNAVIAETADLAPAILYDYGLDVEIKKLSVERYRYNDTTKTEFNPITIIVGRKINQELSLAEE